MSIVARSVLGVNCATDHAYFALVDEDEAVREQDPRRYRMPEAVTGASRLVQARNDLAAELQRARPTAVAMVSPTFVRDRSPSWPDARERATIEVLVELAAAEAGIEFAAHLGSAPRSMSRKASHCQRASPPHSRSTQRRGTGEKAVPLPRVQLSTSYETDRGREHRHRCTGRDL